MILPISWINEYTPLNTNNHEFAAKMTSIGQKVEGYFKESDNIENVVTGIVRSIEKHPNADSLFVCNVDIKENTVTIVTAANNLSIGDIVPVALDGARLPTGKTITKGELRGVMSMGMFCSLAELNLTTADFPDCIEDGIMILPSDTPIGEDICRILNLDDAIFEFEITPNRPDCMSVVGLAREAAAAYNLPFNLKEYPPLEKKSEIENYLKVVLNTKNCLRYCAAVVKNVRVKPSPAWLRERLRKCGLRPINNIVDITNYIMLEYGQPMHAFDHRYVKESTIVVRQAKQAETIVTLDGIEHNLDDSMMVIADAEKPSAVAGVMGSEYSGIYEDTSTVILESACFDSLSVRFTAKKLGMRTDSSALFEKGLDQHLPTIALARALQLIKELDAGDIVEGTIDEYDTLPTIRTIPLDPEAINRHLGTSLSLEFMKKALESFEFSIDENLNVYIPTFRNDVIGMADLAEEVARIYGYDNIPSTIMSGVSVAQFSEDQRFENEIKRIAVALGLYETTTLSFMSNKSLDMICAANDSPLRNAVKISNPFGEETSLMRTTLLPSLMEVLARNFNVRAKTASVFEMSSVYIPTLEDELPIENKSLTIAGYGNTDFYNLKGIVEYIIKHCGIEDIKYLPLTDNPSYHPGRSAIIKRGDNILAVFGELHPLVVSNYGIRLRCYAAEIDVDMIFKLKGDLKQYVELPRFPAISRDLSLVCDEDTTSAIIEDILKSAGKDILESIEVFDVFKGDSLPKRKKSIAYSLTLRDLNKTLTDSDADSIISEMLDLLASKDIVIRR